MSNYYEPWLYPLIFYSLVVISTLIKPLAVNPSTTIIYFDIPAFFGVSTSQAETTVPGQHPGTRRFQTCAELNCGDGCKYQLQHPEFTSYKFAQIRLFFFQEIRGISVIKIEINRNLIGNSGI